MEHPQSGGECCYLQCWWLPTWVIAYILWGHRPKTPSDPGRRGQHACMIVRLLLWSVSIAHPGPLRLGPQAYKHPHTHEPHNHPCLRSLRSLGAPRGGRRLSRRSRTPQFPTLTGTLQPDTRPRRGRIPQVHHTLDQDTGEDRHPPRPDAARRTRRLATAECTARPHGTADVVVCSSPPMSYTLRNPGSRDCIATIRRSTQCRFGSDNGLPTEDVTIVTKASSWTERLRRTDGPKELLPLPQANRQSAWVRGIDQLPQTPRVGSSQPFHWAHPPVWPRQAPPSKEPLLQGLCLKNGCSGCDKMWSCGTREGAYLWGATGGKEWGRPPILDHRTLPNTVAPTGTHKL